MRLVASCVSQKTIRGSGPRRSWEMLRTKTSFFYKVIDSFARQLKSWTDTWELCKSPARNCGETTISDGKLIRRCGFEWIHKTWNCCRRAQNQLQFRTWQGLHARSAELSSLEAGIADSFALGTFALCTIQATKCSWRPSLADFTG